MLEPRPVRQPFRVREPPFAFDQQLVHFHQRTRRHCRTALGTQLLQSLVIFRRAAIQRIHRIFQRSKIQMRRNSFRRRRDERPPRIVRRLGHALFNLPVALANLVLGLLRQRLQLLEIHLHCVRKIAELKRQQIRIRQTHHRRGSRLRQRAAIHKIRVAEMRVPIKIVVNRMVDAAAVLAAKTKVQRSHAIVL